MAPNPGWSDACDGRRLLRGRLRGERGLFTLVAAAAAAVQAVVRLARQRLELVAVVGIEGDPQRAWRALGQRIADAGDQLARVVGADVRQHERELVAAEAPDRVAATDRRLERGDDPAQQLVARRVPEHVVDRLELVDVQHDERARAAGAPHRRQLGHRPLFEAAPVQAAGERVGARRLGERAVLAVLVLRLPAAQHAGAEEDEHEGDGVGHVRTALAERQAEVGHHARRAHDHDRAHRVGHRREDHGEEQHDHERAAGAAVDERAGDDQREVAERPREEQKLAVRAQHHLLAEPVDAEGAERGSDEERGEEEPVRLLPGQRDVDQAENGDAEGERDRGCDGRFAHPQRREVEHLRFGFSPHTEVSAVPRFP